MAAAAVCPLCSHANPADSSFCNECGGSLQLTLCANCEGINHRDASSCHKCGADLARTSTIAATGHDLPNDESVSDVATSQKSKEAPRSQRPRAALVALSLIIPGAAAYYAYHRADAVPTASSSSQSSPAVSQASTAVATPEVVGNTANDPSHGGASTHADETAMASPSVQSTSAEPAQPAPAIAGSPSVAIPDESSRERREDSSHAADAKSARIAPHQQAKGANVGRDASISTPNPGASVLIALPTPPPTPQAHGARFRPPAACTAAVAALGLCDRNKLDEGK